MNDDWRAVRAELQRLETENLLRRQVAADGPSGKIFESGGRALINWSSNNYLDLACHPRVVAAAGQAARRWGAGAGGSRLITGALAIHRELEERLAALKSAEAALVFSSGYMANLGLIRVLSSPAPAVNVPVYFDRLSHACIVDAAMTAKAGWRSFPHNDPHALDRLLSRAVATRAEYFSAVVVTEGVFSMDGDLAPLPALLEVCDRHNAVLVVDDAHATGTIGPEGRGSAAYWQVTGHPRLVQMGTLSKALGSMGGFVAGPRVLIRLLENRARTFIFDTALAPPCAAAALESLRLLDEAPDRWKRLVANAGLLRDALRRRGAAVTSGVSPIVPVVLGAADRTLAVDAALRAAGHLAVAIRPPTVRPGSSRLRLTVMATHAEEDIESLAEALHAAITRADQSEKGHNL
ncbi:MAG: 8-amino-7-oxononanoate synthase [Candidatus Sumerlaeaceae bacterium]|nr:8-amino-7-oxononanoate synthase [Candidatus Sumerlaeaceae bacterium]